MKIGGKGKKRLDFFKLTKRFSSAVADKGSTTAENILSVSEGESFP